MHGNSLSWEKDFKVVRDALPRVFTSNTSHFESFCRESTFNLRDIFTNMMSNLILRLEKFDVRYGCSEFHEMCSIQISTKRWLNRSLWVNFFNIVPAIRMQTFDERVLHFCAKTRSALILCDRSGKIWDVVATPWKLVITILRNMAKLLMPFVVWVRRGNAQWGR